MIVKETQDYWGSKYPMFHCNTWADYEQICKWMYENKVEHFLWSSGSHGYTFDVRNRREWFALRWS